MNKLPSVIGPAPSELPWEALLSKVRGQRTRARDAIASFRHRVAPASRAKDKGLTRTQIKHILKETGMTIEQFNVWLDQRKEGGSEG